VRSALLTTSGQAIYSPSCVSPFHRLHYSLTPLSPPSSPWSSFPPYSRLSSPIISALSSSATQLNRLAHFSIFGASKCIAHRDHLLGRHTTRDVDRSDNDNGNGARKSQVGDPVDMKLQGDMSSLHSPPLATFLPHQMCRDPLSFGSSRAHAVALVFSAYHGPSKERLSGSQFCASPIASPLQRHLLLWTTKW
jgi:hypothetical protein